jgi:hypothetical protein
MYKNEYNRGISNKLNKINQDLINHENKLTLTEPDDHKITSRLEGMVVRNKK